MKQKYNIEWLKSEVKKGLSPKFLFFWGQHKKHGETVGKFCFSQWFELPFTVDNVVYKTAEHWMMAQKALLFNDHKAYERIISAVKPGEVKDIGRRVAGFDESKWNEKRYEIVNEGNMHKFMQNPKYREYLIKTHDRVLVEASPVDAIWGIGLAHDNEKAENINEWQGLNLLGFALMEVRDNIKAALAGTTNHFDLDD